MFTVASLPLRPTDRDRTGVSAPLQFSPSRPRPPAQITRDNAAVRTDAAIRETIWKERVLILNLLKTRRSRQFDQKRDGVFAAAADGDLGSESAARAVHIFLLGLHSQPSRYARHREYLL